LLPREHGAYGQLLFPLVTALAIGRPGVAALSLAAAAIFAFLAHEPLIILLGQRGARAAREQRRRAWRWLAVCVVGAVVCAAIAVALMPVSARIGISISAGLALVLGIAIAARHERTTAGEILTALTLSSLAYPIALAAQAPSRAAMTCAAAFATVFVAATLSVRAVIMCTRRPPAAMSRVIAALSLLVGLAGLAALWQLGLAAGVGVWAALPVCGVGSVLALAPPSATRLRLVGWTLVAATAATAIVLVAVLRLSR
jgi:hypothetical protein